MTSQFPFLSSVAHITDRSTGTGIPTIDQISAAGALGSNPMTNVSRGNVSSKLSKL